MKTQRKKFHWDKKLKIEAREKTVIHKPKRAKVKVKKEKF